MCVAVATRRRAIEKKAAIQEARDRFIAIGPGLSCGVLPTGDQKLNGLY